MNRKKTLKLTLIIGLFGICLGGWLLHLKIHPPQRTPAYWIPFVAGLISSFAVPALFWPRRTLALAYTLNGFLAILGAITMAHMSIVYFEGPITLITFVTGTLFPDIAILAGKFALGRALYLLEFLKTDADVLPKGRYFRYPNMGWWWAHLAGMSAVYALGNILWR